MKQVFGRLLRSIFLLCIFFALITSGFASSEVEGGYTVTATEYRDFVSAEGCLTAGETVEYGTLVNAEVAWTSSSIYVTGTISFPFVIEVVLENNEIDQVIEHTGNYTVLSVLSLGNKLCIIAKKVNQNTIAYIDIHTETTIGMESFNAHWYKDFVFSDIVEVDEAQTLSTGATIDRTYSSVSEIFNGTVEETFKIRFEYSWPQSINNSTGGEFISTIVVVQTDAVYTRTGENPSRIGESSLSVEDMVFSATTPRGDFISYGELHPNALETSAGCLSLGYSVGIPYTPISIEATLPETTSLIDPFFFDKYSLNVTSEPGEQLMAVRATLAGYLKSNTHKYVVILKIDTDTNYQVLGSKMLQIKWNYTVLGSEYTSGVGVDRYLRNDYCSRNLVYELTAVN